MKSISKEDIKQEQNEENYIQDTGTSLSSDKENAAIKEEAIEEIYVKEEPLFYLGKEVRDVADIRNPPLGQCPDGDCQEDFEIPSTSGVTNMLRSETNLVSAEFNKGNFEEVCDRSITILFECSECDFKTSEKQILEDHILKHLNEKQFKCSHCDYAANRKHILNKHLKIHSTTKPYKCFECDFATHRKSSLNNHLVTHSNSKPFKCAECDYTTKHKGNLKTHAVQHSDIKPFECSKCQYVTNLKNNLRKHVRTHFSLKEFKCSECVFSTKTKRGFKKHLHTHLEAYINTSQEYNIIEYKCSECDYVTYRRYALQTHLLRHPNRKSNLAKIMAKDPDINSVEFTAQKIDASTRE